MLAFLTMFPYLLHGEEECYCSEHFVLFPTLNGHVPDKTHPDVHIHY